MPATDNYLYPVDAQNIYAYQSQDIEFSVTLYEDAANTTALDLKTSSVNWTLEARFQTEVGGALLGSVTATNNNSTETGQVIVKVADTVLDGAVGLNDVGGWELWRTDAGYETVFAWGKFEVKGKLTV